ncbi:MAG: hypothetical protein CVU47_00435 [Chloroflexi bacterium HGW-Chloroflexi-9]|nr:MAG: hypothetical protein CVU47_00435 [Chloroflexi bacterium HGW-Chloroflexi-9]
MAGPSAVSTIRGERHTHRADRRDPRDVAGELRCAADAQGTPPRAGHPLRPPPHRPADARGPDPRHLSTPWRAPAPTPAVHDDLVRRRLVADAPNRLWLTDITEHPTGDGKVYCAAVLDVFSRRIVGWSIADHLRTELVVDALEMARWQRHPRSTIVHSDRGTQYTAWAFGQRLRAAGLLGSMGRVASAVDNSMMESFWATMQQELLNRRRYWASRAELAAAIFEWIEAWYDPHRRHTSISDLSPVDYERAHAPSSDAAS